MYLKIFFAMMNIKYPGARQMMKKNLIVFIAAVFIGGSLLGGCNSSDEAQPDPTVSLVYMAPIYGGAGEEDNSYAVRTKKLYPDIDLQQRSYAEEQYYTSLKAQLAIGNGPDLFFVQPDYAGANGVASLAQAGYLEPLDDLACIQALKAEKREDILLEYDSHVYSVATGRMALGVLYRRDIFEKKHLQKPLCWEEFLECCETLKQAGIRPVMMSGKDSNTLQYGIYQIAVNLIYPEMPFYDEELREGKRKFTDENSWDKVLERYLGLYDAEYLGTDIMQTGSQEALRRFQEGEAAMMFVSTNEAESLLQQPGGDYGFFFLPANDRGKPTYGAIDEIGGVSIYAGSKNIEECKKVLTDVFWAGDYLEGDRGFSEEIFPEVQKAFEEGQYFSVCNQGWPNEVELVLEQKIGEYLSGGELTVEEITSAMQRELEK